jgi:hypothetical protein
MSYPHCYKGPTCQLEPFFVDLTMKYTPKIGGKHVRLDNIGASACPMAAFSGFKESHEPPPSGNVCGIVPAHHHSHQNGQQRGGYFASSFCLLSPERVVARWRHLVAFIKALDFQPSVNVHGIAPLHRHGYRKGQRRRYICLLSPHLSFDQNIAKRPCYGPSKDSDGSSLSSAAEAMLGVFSGGVWGWFIVAPR